MTNLQALQKNFQAYLLNREEDIVADVCGPDSETISERLDIYGNGYRYRLVEVLGFDYAILQKYIGDEKFAEMGFAYIDAYPSKFYSVAEFGKYLPKFLAECKPYSDMPYLSDLANFMWKLSWTADAEDGPILKYEDLASIPQENWPAMIISLHPSVKCVKCEWNVLPIWQAVTEEREAPAPEKTSEPNYIAVWRKGIQPYYVAVTPAGAWMLQALQEGKTFEEVCEGLLEWYSEEQVAQEAVNFLLQWLSYEMLSTIVISD